MREAGKLPCGGGGQWVQERAGGGRQRLEVRTGEGGQLVGEGSGDAYEGEWMVERVHDCSLVVKGGGNAGQGEGCG